MTRGKIRHTGSTTAPTSRCKRPDNLRQMQTDFVTLDPARNQTQEEFETERESELLRYDPAMHRWHWLPPKRTEECPEYSNPTSSSTRNSWCEDEADSLTCEPKGRTRYIQSNKVHNVCPANSAADANSSTWRQKSPASFAFDYDEIPTDFADWKAKHRKVQGDRERLRDRQTKW